jgi:GH24 family phage-related lysozyme (muramidase)
MEKNNTEKLNSVRVHESEQKSCTCMCTKKQTFEGEFCAVLCVVFVSIAPRLCCASAQVRELRERAIKQDFMFVLVWNWAGGGRARGGRNHLMIDN